MMAADMPVSTAFVNLLPDNRLQLSAFLVLFSIALFIESPVIDLLSTSTALSRSESAFKAIRKFTVCLMLWTGLVHLVVATTPLFDWTLRVALAQKADVAEAVRLPLLTMLPWSPAIGWRRHTQGLLIRSGTTGPIGVGTALRVSTVALVAWLGFASHRLPGAEVAALALTSSVVVEAVFVHFAGRRALASQVWPESGTLNTRQLLAFHVPLSLSTLVVLTTMPLTSRALASAPDRLLAMSSWQVATGMAFLMRTAAFALPEVVIANWKSGPDGRLLLRFCLCVGLTLTGLMALAHWTGADFAWFSQVMRADADVSGRASQAFFACSLLPLLTAASSFVKGVLAARRETPVRLLAALLSVAALAGGLEAGLAARWPGVLVAAFAVTVSQAAELAVLAGFAWVRKPGPALAEA